MITPNLIVLSIFNINQMLLNLLISATPIPSSPYSLSRNMILSRPPSRAISRHHQQCLNNATEPLSTWFHPTSISVQPISITATVFPKQ